MKKATFYTLLCTTFLIPSLSLAMDQKDGDPAPVKNVGTPVHSRVKALHPGQPQGLLSPNPQATPVKEAKKKKERLPQVLSTPDAYEKKALPKWQATEHSSADQKFFAQMEAKEMAAESREVHNNAVAEIDREAREEMLKRKVIQVEQEREAEQLRQAQLLEAVKSQTSQGQAILKEQIELLSAEIARYSKEKQELEEKFELEKKELQKQVATTKLSAETAKVMLEKKTAELAVRVKVVEELKEREIKALEKLKLQEMQTTSVMIAKEQLEKGLREMTLQPQAIPLAISTIPVTPTVPQGLPPQAQVVQGGGNAHQIPQGGGGAGNGAQGGTANAESDDDLPDIKDTI